MLFEKMVRFEPIYLVIFFINMSGHFELSKTSIEYVVSKIINVNGVDTLFTTEGHFG